MKYNFSKYQGLGNDFIIFDARGNNLDNLFTENKKTWTSTATDEPTTSPVRITEIILPTIIFYFMVLRKNNKY